MSVRTTFYVTVVERHERRYQVCAESAEDAKRMAQEDGEEVVLVEHWTAVEGDE